MKKETTPKKEVTLSFPNMKPAERRYLGRYYQLSKNPNLTPEEKSELMGMTQTAQEIVQRNPGRTELPKA